MSRTILGIETSCDETALAVVECSGSLIGQTAGGRPRFRVLREAVASQMSVHRPWGGVVPNLAKREHLANLPVLERKVFGAGAAAARLWKKIDAIAVTVGPGLEPALWAGITFAQELSKKHNKPLVGTNHLEGHLYSFLLPDVTGAGGAGRGAATAPLSRTLPAIALIVSGGHTILLRVDNLRSWKRLGETRDDAVGEAFDKTARLLGLPYPGGPEISKLARRGDARAIDFPRPMLHSRDNDFSFSGLKTAVLYYLKDHPRAPKADIAASFEEAAVDVLVTKAARAAEDAGARSILLSGGVAANARLRRRLAAKGRKLGIPCLVAPKKYNTDNAVMIAAAGYMDILRKKKYPLRANGNLGI
jgi:N6-L-threonylcarbamoyladenine synthase